MDLFGTIRSTHPTIQQITITITITNHHPLAQSDHQAQVLQISCGPSVAAETHDHKQIPKHHQNHHIGIIKHRFFKSPVDRHSVAAETHDHKQISKHHQNTNKQPFNSNQQPQ
jgi:hypothetical protein